MRRNAESGTMLNKIRYDWSLEEPLRKLVEKLIEEQPGIQITKREGSCLCIEFCGEEMGIETSYLDYLAEKEALYNMHDEAEGDSKKFFESYRKWKSDWRDHFETQYGSVPSRFEEVARREFNS